VRDGRDQAEERRNTPRIGLSSKQENKHGGVSHLGLHALNCGNGADGSSPAETEMGFRQYPRGRQPSQPIGGVAEP
jgi:hypothetical protein